METATTVYATSSKYPRKEKTTASKIQVKIPHQRSPYAVKFEDRSQEETERQERCARGKAWNLAKIFTSSKKRTKPHSIRLPKRGECRPHPPQNLGKRVCGGFWSWYAYGQRERPQLCRIGDHEDFEESDDGDDGHRRGENKRRSHGICRRIGLIRDGVMLLEETPAVFSLGKLCEDHGFSCCWTSGQKPHLTKKDKRINCKIANYVPFVLPDLSTSSPTSSSPASSTSSSQDSIFDVRRYAENPVQERSGSTSEELRGNPLHKPKTKKKVNYAKKYKTVSCMTCRTGYRISERTWSMSVVLQSHGETPCA